MFMLMIQPHAPTDHSNLRLCRCMDSAICWIVAPSTLHPPDNATPAFRTHTHQALGLLLLFILIRWGNEVESLRTCQGDTSYESRLSKFVGSTCVPPLLSSVPPFLALLQRLRIAKPVTAWGSCMLPAPNARHVGPLACQVNQLKPTYSDAVPKF